MDFQLRDIRNRTNQSGAEITQMHYAAVMGLGWTD